MAKSKSKSDSKTMAAAQAKVQANLAKIQALMDESAALMDKHGFTVSVGELDYIPNGLTYVEDEGLLGGTMYFEGGEDDYNDYYAGKWLSSSNYKGC